MFQNLPELFESLTPFSFSGMFAYLGLLLGLILAFVFWFRHLLRFNRTQSAKRRLNAEFRELSAENQSLSERLVWSDNRKSALDKMEASVAKEASNKLQKQRQSSGSYSQSSSSKSSGYAQDRTTSIQGSDSTTSQSTTQITGAHASGGDQFNWESVDGITPRLAAQLNHLGIRDIEHLESLSPADRESLEAKLAFEGHSWNWDWLTNWKTGASTLAAGAAGAAGYAATRRSVDETNNQQENPASVSDGQRQDQNQGTFTSSSNPGWPSDRRAPFELTIPRNSAPEVDWSKVDGVDPKLAAEFRTLGIKNVEQLESLSESDREALEARLKSKGLAWDWGWLNSWNAGLAGLAAATAGAIGWGTGDKKDETKPTEDRDSGSGIFTYHAQRQSSETQDSKPDASHASLSLTPNSSPQVDWSTVKGVDPKLAAEFCTLGIKNVEQLESLSESDREALEARLKSKGLAWDWGWLNSWNAGLAGLAGAIGWGTRDKDNDEATVPTAEDVGSQSDSPKSSLSAWNQQFSSRRSDEKTNKASQTGDRTERSPSTVVKPVRGFAAGVSNSQSGSKESTSGEPRFSLSLPPVNGPQVDWSDLEGVDADLAKELKNLGIQNVQQLESLSFEDRQKLESNMRSKGLMWDWNRLGTWKTSLAGQEQSEARYTVTSSHPENRDTQQGNDFAAGTSQSGSSSLTLQGDKPEFKDDLTLLDGIEGPQAAELQKMGIFNFTQLHNLSLEDQAKLQGIFRQRGWRLDMDQWRIASEGNTEHPSIEDIQRKAFEIYQERDRKGFGGGERTDWEQSEWELRGNPIFSYGVPHDIDDFAVHLTGVTPEARDELYRMGLYNRHQLENLGHDARRMLTRWFAGPRFGVDLTQSFGWLSSMDSVPTDKDFGHVFAIRPTRVDDLSDINGIGGPTEHDLNRIGIYQFDQIANWTATNIVAVNELLNLDGRIDQDQWVVQAQRLVQRR